jgi:PAS domain-containing protein
MQADGVARSVVVCGLDRRQRAGRAHRRSTDEQGRIVEFNPAAEAMFGHSARRRRWAGRWPR